MAFLLFSLNLCRCLQMTNFFFLEIIKKSIMMLGLLKILMQVSEILRYLVSYPIFSTLLHVEIVGKFKPTFFLSKFNSAAVKNGLLTKRHFSNKFSLFSQHYCYVELVLFYYWEKQIFFNPNKCTVLLKIIINYIKLVSFFRFQFFFHSLFFHPLSFILYKNSREKLDFLGNLTLICSFNYIFVSLFINFNNKIIYLFMKKDAKIQ